MFRSVCHAHKFFGPEGEKFITLYFDLREAFPRKMSQSFPHLPLAPRPPELQNVMDFLLIGVKCLREPIDRTSGTPGSDRNMEVLKRTYGMHKFRLKST